MDSTRTRLGFFFNDLDLTRTRTLETRAWTRTRGIVTRLQHWYRPAPFHLHPPLGHCKWRLACCRKRLLLKRHWCRRQSCHSNMSDQWGSIRPLRDICVKMIQSKKKKTSKLFALQTKKKISIKKKKCSIKKKKNSIKEK